MHAWHINLIFEYIWCQLNFLLTVIFLVLETAFSIDLPQKGYNLLKWHNKSTEKKQKNFFYPNLIDYLYRGLSWNNHGTMCVHVKESSEGFWLLGPDALIIIPHLEPPFGRIFPKLIPKSQEDLEMFAYNLQITTKVQIFFWNFTVVKINQSGRHFLWFSPLCFVVIFPIAFLHSRYFTRVLWWSIRYKH